MVFFFADGQVPPERGPLRGRLRALDREAGRAGPVLNVMVFSKKKKIKGKFIRVPDCLPPNGYLRCVYVFSCQKKMCDFFLLCICPPKPLPLFPPLLPYFLISLTCVLNLEIFRGEGCVPERGARRRKKVVCFQQQPKLYLKMCLLEYEEKRM